MYTSNLVVQGAQYLVGNVAATHDSSFFKYDCLFVLVLHFCV